MMYGLAFDEIIGKAMAVFRRSEGWEPCLEARFQQSSETYGALLTLSGVGPSQGLWIECAGLESDGWIRRPVIGAPISAGSLISEWIKLPEPYSKQLDILYQADRPQDFNDANLPV